MLLTKATVGQGAIITGDARTGKGSLAGVNRDSLNTETITKDVQTGGLAVDTGIDTRVLTSKGRDEIAKEQKRLPENVRQTTENIVKSLPNNNFKQKTLAVLDNMEARLAEVPVAFKEVGGDLLEAYPEYIKQGGEPEDFEAMFNNTEVLGELKEINNLLAEAATYQESYRQQTVLEYMNKDGLTQEQALQEVEKDIASSNYLLNNYAAINDTKDTKVNSNTAAEYSSTDGLSSKNDDTGNAPDKSSLQAGNGDYDGDEGPSVTLDTINVIANRVTLLPNASSDTAIIGNDSIAVSNDSSLAIDMLSKSAQIKRKVDKVVAMTGINPDDAMLAVTLALKGPIALVQPAITDALVGEKLEQGIGYVQNTATSWVHNSDVDTVASLTDGFYVQGNQTIKQLSEQLALTKEGVGIITTVALGATSAAGVTYLGTKTDGRSSTPSMGINQRGAIGDVKPKPVQELEVGSYKELKNRAVVGDNLEHDHIPSFAALKKAKEAELKRELSARENKELYNNATTVEVPKTIHAAGRTYKGKNNPSQITNDAKDLCTAQNCDLETHKRNLLNKGYSEEKINKFISEVIERNKELGIK